ncbi:hypothetical protein [uncultured Sphingomonas sp.]|uniref:hypothetical protein n=1 Tax=uncultured Sphingomonas sp. TaxID=158754 RepID=UPI0035CBB83B
MLDADPAVWTGPDDWVLPGRAQLWIVLASGPVSARLRRRAPIELGRAVVFGPTTSPIPFAGSGGVSVALDLTPAGWARFSRRPAAELRDRVEPADDMFVEALGRDWVTDLVAALHASDQAEQVAPLLDAFFLDRLPPAHADEADAAAVATALERDGLSLGDASAHLGLSRCRVGRMSERYIGHAPGLVRRRARLLRVLVPALMTDSAMPVVPPGYHDAPHLGRDAREFLTMTARRFLALPMPYLRAALRARTAVIGAPLAVLDGDRGGFV